MVTLADLTKDQVTALDKVHTWLPNPRRKPLMNIRGFAGTGKTTIANFIEGYSILYVAPTGKAALVLRKKGCGGACTIHSAMYRAELNKSTGKWEYHWNHESVMGMVDLIVVDEGSMVGQRLGEDMLRFGTPILSFSDPFQLPPVNDDTFLPAHTDHLLTEIMRQAEGDPIITMSMMVRNGESLKIKDWGTSSVDYDYDPEELLKYDQVLCGKNATRRRLNARIRKLLGYGSEMIVQGEKLICLRNDHKKGLLNGGMWEVDFAMATESNTMQMVLNSLDTDQTEVEVEVPFEFFQGTEDAMNPHRKAHYQQFTYGGAMTVHKAQGSQWDSVLLIDESRSFPESDRHLYTGITRAAKSIKVVK